VGSWDKKRRNIFYIPLCIGLCVSYLETNNMSSKSKNGGIGGVRVQSGVEGAV
jgi:hypothetical protein